MDEAAFKIHPDVGAAPDMIEDDLPSNPEYLETFAGPSDIEVISEDELVDHISESHREGSVEDDMPRITSDVNGETIKMLVPKLTIIEHYFTNLPPVVP